MIPRTFPTTVEPETGNREMVVYYLSDITGLSRWVDYIPVRTVQNEVSEEDNTNANGFQAVSALSSITGKVAFIDYVPVYEDGSATVPFSTNADGYIPVGISGGGSATLFLNFAYSKALDSRITFTRADATTCATYFDSTGVLRTAAANIPRFDHDPATGVCKGLLIEESRQNICLQSANFSTTWSMVRLRAFGSGSVVNAIAAPDGTVTADKIVEDTTASNSHRITQSITTTAAAYNFSVYVKAAGRTKGIIKYASSTSTFEVVFTTFDLTAGTISAVSASNGATAGTSSITFVGDGWYRVSLSGQIAAKTNGVVTLGLLDASGNESYNGDGTSGMYLWGAQLELGSFPTSYIHTTTGAVTRAADVASMTGTNFSSWWNGSAGTFAVICDQYSATGTRPIFRCDDNTANESFTLRGNVADPEFIVVDGGVTQAQIDVGTISANIRYKIAAAYSLNDIAACKDSGAVGTDASATIPTVTQARIGFDGTNYLNGHVAKIIYYPNRLSNAVLQSLSR